MFRDWVTANGLNFDSAFAEIFDMSTTLLVVHRKASKLNKIYAKAQFGYTVGLIMAFLVINAKITKANAKCPQDPREKNAEYIQTIERMRGNNGNKS
jgi:hypothetical protein